MTLPHSQSQYSYSQGFKNQLNNAKRLFSDNKSFAGSLQSSNVILAKPRMVTVNIPLPSEQLSTHKSSSETHKYQPIQQYVNNRIRTSKYSLLTFVPKNLFEQFRRVANTFFLFLVILQAFNQFATINVFVAAIPIMFIVFVTALKDAVEDYKRWSNDKLTNNRTCRAIDHRWKNYNYGETDHTVISNAVNKIKSLLPDNEDEVQMKSISGDFKWVDKKWKHVKVGDIIKLSNDDPIPADMILLASSEPDCVAYIETKNLDGESNLKLRQGPIETSYIKSADDMGTKLKCVIDSEPPTTNMLRYQATMTLYPPEMKENEILETLESGKVRSEMLSQLSPPSTMSTQSGQQRIKRIPLDINSTLLRGTVLKNTQWIIGVVIFTGEDTKQVLNSGKTPSKRSKVDKLMNPHVAFNLFFMIGICLICAIAYGNWLFAFQNKDNSYLTGYLYTDYGYQSFINFFSALILFQNIVPISLYISVEIVKTIQAYFIYSDIDLYYEEKDTPCNPKSWNLADNLGQIEYIFSDKTGTLTRNIMAFKKVCIDGKVYDGNTKPESINLLSVSTGWTKGHSKKISTSQLSFKAPWVEGVRESQGQREVTRSMSKLPSPNSDVGFRKGHKKAFSQDSSASYMNKGHKKRISWNKKPEQLIEEEPNLSEDEIVRQKVNVQNESTGWVDEAIESYLTVPELQNSVHSLIIKDFFTLLAVCHTVLVEDKTDKDGTLPRPETPQLSDDLDGVLPPKVISYKAQSPDEACLVTTAAENGFIFKGREHNSSTNENQIVMEILGKEIKYTLLNVIEFDSDRKRMSVIVRTPANKSASVDNKGDIIIFCKGADSVIFERLMPGQQEMMDKTSKHLEDFAQEGLRTLCLAYKRLPEEFYQSWSKKYHELQTQIFPDPYSRAKAFEGLNEQVESNLVLLGATAIEDKLQDGVPKCIKDLCNAGIKIWVLTGDKLETAINIGFLCGLLKTTEAEEDDFEELTQNNGMVLIQVKNAKTEEEIQRQLTNAYDRFWGKGSKYLDNKTEFALIIDGQSLKLAFDSEEMKQLLLDIGCQCKAVICCRVSPLQKAKVVELVKHGKSVMTLAIGDGANDVSMIQAADIGVGISGEEGLQAASSADYAIAQFRFLTKLLLVHGRWSYSRISYMILNFYLKSIVFSQVIFWFQIYCGFSSGVIYEFTYMLFYNLLFTSLPIMALGIFDQDLKPEYIMAFKPIYKSEGISRSFYTHTRFFVYIIESIWHSLVCFYVTYFQYLESSQSSSGLDTDGYQMGTVMATSAIILVNLSVAMDVRSWTWLIHVSVWGSSLLFIVYLLIVSTQTDSPIYGLAFEIFSQGAFWFVFFLSIILSLGPRFLFYFIRKQYAPTDSDIVGEIQNIVENDQNLMLEYFPKSVTANNSVKTSRNTSVVQSRRQSGNAKDLEDNTNNFLAVPSQLQRRPSQNSNISSFNMETGASQKVTGFSFSHTKGMGGVVLQSPLDLFSFKGFSGRPSQSDTSHKTKSRLTWPSRPVTPLQSSIGPQSAPPDVNPQLPDVQKTKQTGKTQRVQIVQKDQNQQTAQAKDGQQSMTTSPSDTASNNTSPQIQIQQNTEVTQLQPNPQVIVEMIASPQNLDDDAIKYNDEKIPDDKNKIK